MFDYARRLQLALGDSARRTGLKAAAGGALLLGAGFLIAALWSWLATGLGWGSSLASLAIGCLFVAIGVVVLATAARSRHAMPTTDDLKREVEARLSLAADAAVNRARAEAARMADMAENKVQSLVDGAEFRASKLAADAERRVYGFVRDTAQGVGLSDDRLRAARAGAKDAGAAVSRAAASNPGSMAKLIGAFAVGVTLAARLKQGRRSRPEQHDPDDFL